MTNNTITEQSSHWQKVPGFVLLDNLVTQLYDRIEDDIK